MIHIHTFFTHSHSHIHINTRALADPRLRLSFYKSRALELDALALRSVMLRNRPPERRERRLVYLWGGIYMPVEPADDGEPLSGRRAHLVRNHVALEDYERAGRRRNVKVPGLATQVEDSQVAAVAGAPSNVEV